MDFVYFTAFLTHVSTILITFVTLLIYVNRNDVPFNAGRLFTALALFNQLTVPLFIFPITVPIIIAAVVSTKRLEKFLSQPEVEKELEGVKHMARFISQSDASLDILEETTVTNEVLNRNSSNEAPITAQEDFSITPENTLPHAKDLDCTATHSLERRKATLRKGSPVTRTFKYGRESQTSKSVKKLNDKSIKLSDEFVVQINDTIFSWNKDDFVSTLTVNSSILVPKGKLTLIIGHTGSGKSSFLAALLQEMYKVEEGKLLWDK